MNAIESDNDVTPMEWRVCPRFPDYEVSEFGDMRRNSKIEINQSGRRLNGVIDSDGYIRYAVKNGIEPATSIASHVAVAEAFIGEKPNEDYEVAHKNGSRIANHFSNLRWATRKENSDDRYVHGTSPVGEFNPKAKITEDDVRYIRKRYREIKLERGNVAELDVKFGLTRSQVIRIAKMQAWSHVK